MLFFSLVLEPWTVNFPAFDTIKVTQRYNHNDDNITVLLEVNLQRLYKSLPQFNIETKECIIVSARPGPKGLAVILPFLSGY